MKDYFLLFEDVEFKLSSEEQTANLKKWQTWLAELQAGGHFRFGQRLLPEERVVSEKDGDPFITDGPFTEGKEVIGGFFLIAAEDIHEASQLAAGCPVISLGGKVSIRPVMMAAPNN